VETLHVVGNYVQTTQGSLRIELGGEGQYDVLRVTGTATVAGGLVLSLINGFVPEYGDTFRILALPNVLSISGNFSQIGLPSLPGSLFWDLSELYVFGIVSVDAPSIAGDFNGDRFVTAADYVYLRKNNFLASDYGVWRSHFGQSASGRARPSTDRSTTSVPEPATWLCLIEGLVGSMLFKRVTSRRCLLNSSAIRSRT
jgi:hypothetical protein